MAAPKENSLFSPSPYFIPGYNGFIPQYKYQFGETFGKTTYHLLTDPDVRKSPRPLLVPLHKQKFIEDFSGTKHGVQGYLPGRPDYFPHEKAGAATSLLGPKPPLPRPEPTEEEPLLMHMDPEHHPKYLPRTHLPEEYPRGIASEGQEWRLPEITLDSGHGARCGPSQLSRALAGSKPPIKMEGVTLPEVAGTADVEQDNWLPKLDVPNVIQQKVIPGYTGFIPRLAWTNGVSYIQSVKEAMSDFDRQQFLQRNPPSSFGKRFPQTYWPDYRIYTSAGLIPFYMGFVPHNRHNYALTFGSSTRKAYQKEQERRAFAL